MPVVASAPATDASNLESLKIKAEQGDAKSQLEYGKAIAYMLKHWEPLTLFLRVPGAVLDNNIAERALKKTVLHQKNALFYRTDHGANVGDLFMSLTHTAALNRINPFDYLVALLRNQEAVAADPALEGEMPPGRPLSQPCQLARC